VEGIIRFFDSSRNFGFIDCTDELGYSIQSVFFPGTHLLSSVATGDVATFWITDDDFGRAGWMATEVQRAGSKYETESRSELAIERER
jgi:hypothetical protein